MFLFTKKSWKIYIFDVCFQTISIEAIIRNAFNFSIVESFSCCREIALLVAFDTQAFDTHKFSKNSKHNKDKLGWQTTHYTYKSGWIFPQKGL